MIKVIIFAVVGLVLGLGGGSGFAVMRAKKAAAAAHDSVAVKGDSATKHEREGEPRAEPGGEHTAVAAAPADSSTQLAHAAPKPDSVATTAAVPTHGGPAAASHGPSVPSAPVVAPKVPVTDAAKEPSAPGRISKIFAAMSAKDAAKVLQQMDDTDVQTVLSGLNDKQAAAILAGFTPERAAAISKAQLRRKGTS